MGRWDSVFDREERKREERNRYLDCAGSSDLEDRREKLPHPAVE
jgi:hypothetical protein